MKKILNMEKNVSSLYQSYVEDNEREEDVASDVIEEALKANEKDCQNKSSEILNEEAPEQEEPEKELDNVNETDPDESEKENPSIVELSEIKTLLLELSTQFESKLKYDIHKNEIIDKLHAENQSYKNDLFKKIVSPFVNEVIYLIDDYTNLYKKHAETELAAIDTAKLLKQFGSISEDLEELLNKNGIESFSVEGNTVDFSKQKVVKTVMTDIPERDKTIHERIKKGFMMDGKVIRQEYVSCYKLENNSNQ